MQTFIYSCRGRYECCRRKENYITQISNRFFKEICMIILFSRSIPVLINESLLYSFEEITVIDECSRSPITMAEDQDMEGDWEQVNEDLTDMDIPSRTFYSMTSDVTSTMYTGRQSESAIGLMSSAAASVLSIFKTNKR